MHHSAAEVERTFSVEKEVLTLECRKISQSTFNRYIQCRERSVDPGVPED